MNTYTLDTRWIKNNKNTDMGNIQWEGAVQTDNGLWVAIDDKGYSYKFDENGTLLKKKRISREKHVWTMMHPLHGEKNPFVLLHTSGESKYETKLAWLHKNTDKWGFSRVCELNDYQISWLEDLGFDFYGLLTDEQEKIKRERLKRLEKKQRGVQQ